MTATPSPFSSDPSTIDYPRQFVSLETVAALAGVARDVAYRWVRTGQLAAIRLGSAQWRVERTVLEAFLRDRSVGLTLAGPAS